ncbi:hypothetical protein VTL71DRAFT_1025 [Oculimacula yallundae]|uniref:Uncharacterized protein n=1 Tax=Oculimacula yallundae TaxID=86028 RepID=A0ABR4D2P4_9HELO
MATFIFANSYSLEKYALMYDKHPKKMHRETKAVGSILIDAKHCLSVLAFLVPEDIPQQPFERSDEGRPTDDAIEKFGRGHNVQLIGLFEKTIAIDGIQLKIPGYCARHLYALSHAKARQAGCEELSSKTKREALALGALIFPEFDEDHWDSSML